MEFNKELGSILFDGYYQGGKMVDGEENPKIRIGKNEAINYEAAVSKFHFILGKIKPSIILTDYDSNEAFECRLKIAKELNQHCIAIKGAHKGGHIYWANKTQSIFKSNSGNETALSLYPTDYKAGIKMIKARNEIVPSNEYGALSKDDGAFREIVFYNPKEDGTLDEVPFYDRAINSKRIEAKDAHKFIGSKDGDGRNEALFTYMISMKAAGFSYEQYLEAVNLINHHVFAEPIRDSEFETVTRQEAWENLEGSGEKKAVTPETFSEFLKGSGIIIRYNEALNIVEYENLPKKFADTSDVSNIMPIKLQYAFREYTQSKMISKAQTTDLISVVADNNSYNPIKDYLLSASWDGKDRFPIIYDFLGVTDEFEQMLIKKWFIQTAAMPFNTIKHSLQLEGVLILQGEEGIGKTRFFRCMTPDPRWFSSLDKEMTTKNKDILIEMLSVWIAEIGEFDRTTKANKSDLKNFMTQDKDTIRKPYRPEQVVKARTTSFCGTTNKDVFLNSDTGSRRWWVVHTASEDTFNFKDFFSPEELKQFWGQCYQLFKEDKNSFRLTAEERMHLKGENLKAMEMKPGEDELRAWLDFKAPMEKWQWVAPAAMITQSAALQKYSPKQIGEALARMKESDFPMLDKKHSKIGNVWLVPPYVEGMDRNWCNGSKD